MRLIAKTISEIPPSPHKPWNQRIVLGCWAAKFLPLCAKYLPGFAITHIGFSLSYARQFLAVPNVSFNILQRTLISPYFGARFLQDAKTKGRPVFDWTVNEESMMKWSISKGLDGVITDDPKKFLEVCDDWERGKREIVIVWKQWVSILWVQLMVIVFGSIFWWKYGGREGKKRRIEKGKESVALLSKMEGGVQ